MACEDMRKLVSDKTGVLVAKLSAESMAPAAENKERAFSACPASA